MICKVYIPSINDNNIKVPSIKFVRPSKPYLASDVCYINQLLYLLPSLIRSFEKGLNTAP